MLNQSHQSFRRAIRPASAAFAALLFATLIATAPASKSKADVFRRLGGPERLVELRALETQTFDFDRFSKLESWSGDSIDAETLADRVLVLLAWDQSEARSVRLLPTLSRLNRTMSEKALCIAVHAQDGWADAKERIDAGRVPIASAHDADGAFLKSLQIDEHPNLFIIDKAGQIRCADLDPRDLTRAVSKLSNETPQQARDDLPRRIRLNAESQRMVPSSLPSLSPAQKLGARPGIETPRPPAAAYSAANWPAENTENLNATNVQGRQLPVPLGNETWLTERPERALNEHVLILDFWATWCGPCIRASPTLDQLQTRYQDQLLVMGMAGQAAGSRYPEDERAIRAHMASHPVSYSHLHDSNKRVYASLNVRAIPHVVVISTDGIVRWQGNPLDPKFRRAVDMVLANDPLLAARRAQQPGRSQP